MSLRRMYDAAFPPDSPPPWEVVAGYVGGDTPHVWTVAEWDRQPARFRLPIWVRSFEPSSAPQDAAAAIRAFANLGVPLGKTVALDLETLVSAYLVGTFNSLVTRAGWRLMKYGSRATINQNPATSGGTWSGDWDKAFALDGGSLATQFESATQLGTGYDASAILDTVPLWDTNWSAGIMEALTTVKQGDTGFDVGVLQSVLNGSWHQAADPVLTVDKVFGATTTARLKVVQERHGLTADGVCGPATWALLLLEKTG